VQKKKETEILTMYFEEGLKLDIIRDTLKESEESIKSVILGARQKALKKLVEKDMGLQPTPNSIKKFINCFIQTKMTEFKQTGLKEQALQYLLTNIFQLVLDESKEEDKKMDAHFADIANQFPEFRLEKLDQAPSGPNQLTGREMKKLSDFIKKQIIQVLQATRELFGVHFVCDLVTELLPSRLLIFFT
jgi:hypothetical protein